MLNFLEIGFQHILESLSNFYKKEDHNIAFMALHQSPMITALNTGKILIKFKQNHINAESRTF